MRMKMTILILTVTMVISAGICQKQVSAQQGNVSYQVFYDHLSPYGQWIDYPNYGNVWVPNAGPGFSPYSTNGYWIHTQYGWTWMSDYTWGWAPFHYGRWDYDSFYGWLWVPGYEWGPSWVNWRSSSGYYGWQPMRPGFGVYSSFYNNHYNNFDHWTFVRNNDFGRYDIYNYYVNRSDYPRIIENSRIIDNTSYDRRRQVSYISGPDRRDVQKISGNRIRSVAVRDHDMPVQQLSNNRLQLYRPQINAPDGSEQMRLPSRTDRQDIRQLPENRRGVQQQQGTTPENTRPARQVSPQNQQINRGESDRVQPTPPVRVPVETPRRQSQPVRGTQQINNSESQKVATPARVETQQRTRQPLFVIPSRKKDPENK